MATTQSEKASAMNRGDENAPDAGAEVLRKLMETREVRRLLAGLLPEVLHVYAGKSRFKQFIARRMGSHIGKSLTRSRDVGAESEIRQLFEDSHFIEDIAAPLPDLVNGLFDLMSTAAATIEEFPTSDKKALFADVIAKMANGRSATLVTRGCRILNDLHRDDPEFFARTLEPGFAQWIEAVDFGELKEAVDHSAQDVRATVEMANRVIWQYPAKVVLLLSVLPSVANRLVETADISIGKLNELSPDLLTDVIATFITEIDSRSMARLTNEITELFRKIHTGSGLLGEPGAPHLTNALTEKIEVLVDDVDPAVLWKARLFFAETRATIDGAIAQASADKPELRQFNLARSAEMTNIGVRALNQRLSVWTAMDDREMASAVKSHLAACDVQEMAELANNALALFNRFADQNPETLAGMVGRFTEAIDDFELAESAGHLFDNTAEAVEPAARAVVPKLVQWVCGVLEARDDEYEEDAEQARAALQTLFEKAEA